MNTGAKYITAFVTLILCCFSRSLAQSPPNDDFANRIVLTGSSLIFTGTFEGSTVETAEGPGFQGYYPPPGGGSVWWTWTTPVITRVVVEILRDSASYITNAELEVYTGNALNALTSVDQNGFQDPPGRYVSFMAYPTNNYQIRAAGIATQSFSLRLTATNPPIFISQPKDCVVSQFGSGFFSALATGLKPTDSIHGAAGYQWLFNGTPITGQTSPSLLVSEVTTNQAGVYSVIASNAGGVTESAPAMLSVTNTEPVRPLIALPSINPSEVQFALSGETGRWYTIESSPDLSLWLRAGSVHLTNDAVVVSVSRFGNPHFSRAWLDVPTDTCVGQLKQLRWATRVLGIEHRLSPTDAVSLNDIKPYVPLTPQGNIIQCPGHGFYSLGGRILDNPTCVLGYLGHVLTDTP
jgi:hypothetical protein